MVAARSESVASAVSNYSEISEEEACVFAPGSPTGHQVRHCGIQHLFTIIIHMHKHTLHLRAVMRSHGLEIDLMVRCGCTPPQGMDLMKRKRAAQQRGAGLGEAPGGMTEIDEHGVQPVETCEANDFA